ncbi:GlxA family transcriptional regulator [Streptomyces olivochromogenes]|uniref:GlxA family transcriptional regulator n=1 Tax=Streptomyces olivochromogenes TaxID=1963 RepID=UPI001F38F526|nr:helix-turn-helix domain-containing protein [Streptomyces olivochromogenes]MCF3133825.1 DJ-1/PfpI family protein [Streptomyces olivochromogenes]
MKIGVVALGGCWDSGVTAVLDVLRTADAARARVDATIPALECVVVTATDEAVRTAGGLLIPAGRLIDDCVATTDLDLILVPALAAQSPATMVDALMRQDIRAVRTALRRWADGGGALAAACTGTFVLAEAGLLDQRRATTTWWLRDFFRRRYPAVHLDMSRMVVRDGGVVTAGAAFAHIDLALSIVAQVSPRLAAETAGALLIDERPTPSTGVVTDYLKGHDQLVSDFEAWVRAHLHSPVGVADAALALGVTRRTLERHVRDRLSTSPYAFIRSLRAERAEHLRATTALPVADIAQRVGYQDATSVRRLRSGRQPLTRRSEAGPNHVGDLLQPPE